jgi:hypothetical protein
MAPAQERTGGLFLGNGSVADSTGERRRPSRSGLRRRAEQGRKSWYQWIRGLEFHRNSERSDLDTDSAPESVEVRVITGKAQMAVAVRKSDWSHWTAMMDLGMMMGPHPHLAVGPCRARLTTPILGDLTVFGRAYNPARFTRRVRSSERRLADLLGRLGPTCGAGGFFQVTPGMDPAQQRLLDSAVFDDYLPWDVLDRAMDCVRSEQQVPPDAPAEMRSLAQALTGVVGLQQWDPLSTFLGNLPQDVREGLGLSPARLAALLVVAR